MELAAQHTSTTTAAYGSTPYRDTAGPVRPWAATRATRVRYITYNTSTSEPQVSCRTSRL